MLILGAVEQNRPPQKQGDNYRCRGDIYRWPSHQHAAGSAAALDRLRTHSEGPLIEILDLPNTSRFGQTGTTIPLVCLTDAGRAHVATHAPEYERLYPEVPR